MNSLGWKICFKNVCRPGDSESKCWVDVNLAHITDTFSDKLIVSLATGSKDSKLQTYNIDMKGWV